MLMWLYRQNRKYRLYLLHIDIVIEIIMSKKSVISSPFKLSTQYDETKNLESTLLLAQDIKQKKTSVLHNKADIAYDNIHEQLIKISNIAKNQPEKEESLRQEVVRLLKAYMGSDTSLGQWFGKERNTQNEYRYLMKYFLLDTPTQKKEGVSRFLPRRIAKAFEPNQSTFETSNITKNFKDRISHKTDDTETSSQDSFKGTNPMKSSPK